ncbi:conserved hypothetical protein [Enterococcus faecium 1,231,501]|nr:conserved hypothetical protein [Enterococcus faecium 1,231,501]KST43615.1 hypothetical protein AOY34_13345 [Enterococcus faecium]
MQIRQLAKIAIHLQALKFERIILVVKSTITKGLNQLIDRITNGKIEKVVILYKSCLIRFGYELSETLCNIWYRI